MVRKCSHCGNVGHNSRTCTIKKQKLRGRFKLFGVQLDGASSSASSANLLKKNISLNCSYNSTSTPSCSDQTLPSGYPSDGLITKTQERKKGVPWSEEEHRVFLVGLHKLGKGDWRGISRKFVTTRTPTQVASHAQKYFLRLNNRKPRRPTLFYAARRDKFTVQVVEGNNSKLTNLPSWPPIHYNIYKSIAAHSEILPWNTNDLQNSLPIWYGYEGHKAFKFLQNPIKFSSKTSHFQAPDLQLSLSTPKEAEQALLKNHSHKWSHFSHMRDQGN